MILGVYWYFKFPEKLYQFRFFTFFEGRGGHADTPAGLIARVKVTDPEYIIQELEILKSRFQKTHLDIKISGQDMVISIDDHLLFDYHFQLVSEIDSILTEEQAVWLDDHTPFTTEHHQVFTPEREPFIPIEDKFIQITGSDFKKNNAENLSVRIDCNLPVSQKQPFIGDLKEICHNENLSVFYYYRQDYNDHCNLMLFFTNGRQKEDSFQNINIHSFGSHVRRMTEKYRLHFGHFGGLKYYPTNGPHIELITDKEYIINPISTL
ncbi:MAG: hypothetical protein LBE92_09835 [Chryseobacterium sp.]|jgi:hypothetical protein|uniref:hypothetical protein n=1 Tax=Chryseobacterium sp. TaxID=1871047 RepID=UPI002833E62C|nr:hypothetical protein [Chryseobacterium sp.]MDR2236414.1 hypothetical protein [Chryseobacterium sp.]